MPAGRVVLLWCFLKTCESGITSTPKALTQCSGQTAVLNWTYSDAQNLSSLKWTKDATTVLIYNEGTGPNPNRSYAGRVSNIDGVLSLSNTEPSDSGYYTLTVSYNNTATDDSSSVQLTVHELLTTTVSTSLTNNGDRTALLKCKLQDASTGSIYSWTDSNNRTLATGTTYITQKCGVYTCRISGDASSCLKTGLFSKEQVTEIMCPSNTCYGISFGIGFGLWGIFIGVPLAIVSKRENAWEKRKIFLILTVVGYAVITLTLLLALSLTLCFTLKSCDCIDLEVRTGCGIGFGTTLISATIETVILIVLVKSCERKGVKVIARMTEGRLRSFMDKKRTTA